MADVTGNGRKERSPRVSSIFSLGVEKERADTGRDGRKRRARPHHSQARMERGENLFSLFS